MAASNYTTTINGERHVWREEPEHPEPCAIDPVFVARADNKGMLIPGSRLSQNFTSISAAFDAREDLCGAHPDAAVFNLTRGVCRE